jgi:hypothetical protein
VKDRPQYRLVLQAQPGDVPPIHRLRLALKYLLRVQGLKCVEAEAWPTTFRPRGR